MSDNRIVIVGAGMAGITLAREFRKLDSDTPVTLVTEDAGEQYAKPMLSNALAQGKTPDQLVQKDADRLARDLDIEILSRTRVEGIDREGRRLILASNAGEGELHYRQLVLAVGASPRKLPIPGDDRVPVASVNSLDDYRDWRAGLRPSDRILLIGAGLIGIEFANDLASAGHPVTVVDPAPQPLGRLLPQELGALLARTLSAADVLVQCGTTVARLETGEGGSLAVLDNARRVSFDHALSAIGLIANTGLAERAELAVGRGIQVDALLRTSDPAIHALGDCAETPAGVLPFVLPLMAQARALARTLAGNPTPLALGALPVVVKTPALPMVVCPPPAGAEGTWEISGTGPDRRALFLGTDGAPLGFALTGAATRERQSLTPEMPALLAA